MRGILDLDLLRTFVAVVETKSFTAAAPVVGRSQSAVSMQIIRLEGALGKPLLVRTSRSVFPNAAGKELLGYSRRLLKLSQEAWGALTVQSEAGSVRLGVPEDYAASLLPRVLRRFANEHPQVAVELVCEQSEHLNIAIRDDRVDLAILTRAPSQPIEVLRRERMVWVSSPTHAAWEDDPLPVALFNNEVARENVVSALRKADKAFRCTYSSASFLGMAAIVQSGLSVAALALCSVPDTLLIIGEAEGLPRLADLEVGLLRNARSDAIAVDRLHDALRRDLSTDDRNGPGAR